MAEKTGGKNTTTTKAASRIQSNADHTGTNARFKARAQSAAAKSSGSAGKSGKK